MPRGNLPLCLPVLHSYSDRLRALPQDNDRLRVDDGKIYWLTDHWSISDAGAIAAATRCQQRLLAAAQSKGRLGVKDGEMHWSVNAPPAEAAPATIALVLFDDEDFVVTPPQVPKVTKKKARAQNVPYVHYEEYPNKAAANKAARMMAPQKTKHANNKHQYDWKCTRSTRCTKLIRRKGA